MSVDFLALDIQETAPTALRLDAVTDPTSNPDGVHSVRRICRCVKSETLMLDEACYLLSVRCLNVAPVIDDIGLREEVFLCD